MPGGSCFTYEYGTTSDMLESKMPECFTDSFFALALKTVAASDLKIRSDDGIL